MVANEANSSGRRSAGMSRRRDMRFGPPRELRCSVVGSAATLTVRDISVGGMSLSSTLPLTRNVLHEFRLTLGNMTISRRGRAVYCRRQAEGHWIIGIAFTKERSSGKTVEELIDLITSSILRFS